MVDIDEIKGKDLAGDGAENPTLIEAASEAIMNAFSFLTVEETDEIWYYENGVYISGGEILIAKEAEKMFGYALTKGKLSEIQAHIRRRTYHKHEELDSDTNIINLRNGLYDIEKSLLLEHSPQYLSINQKPITYVKDSQPQLLHKFLTEVLYERDIQTAIDSIAYTFHRDYDIEVLFKLYGHGSNGKSVFTSLITRLHGIDNVSNVPMSEMLTDKFALSDLENKDVNIDNELGSQTIKEASVLKRLTGGSRQRIRIQRKNQRAYDTTLYAKLFFNTNAVPDSADKSDAYNRRIIIIAFPNIFEGASEDKQLITKLTTEEEISGIFNICMDALRCILKNKQLYVNEKTVEERREKYERTVNPIKSFYDEAVSEYSIASDIITKEDLHKQYVIYCRKHAIPYERYELFCKNVKHKLELSEKRPIINEERIRCWSGVRLTEEYGGPPIQLTSARLS